MTTPAQKEVLDTLSEAARELYRTGKIVFNDDGKGCGLIRKEVHYAPPMSVESLTPEQKTVLDASDNRVWESFMTGRLVFGNGDESNILVDAVPLD